MFTYELHEPLPQVAVLVFLCLVLFIINLMNKDAEFAVLKLHHGLASVMEARWCFHDRSGGFQNMVIVVIVIVRNAMPRREEIVDC